ncbi:MAG: tRNA (N6-threonylcarbamoyladenosine(37)-N6)-methyltransferase TrmO [Lachnospiraceae bacterium]
MKAVILKIIARIRTDFPEKFGVPRQSGLADTKGVIVFEPKYRDPEALRGIEGFSHLWILWGFSEVPEGKWSPTVRPPRLGGNKREGVFATRSPFRPNPVGLSCVKLERIEQRQEGLVLCVSGVDMTDGTPVFDIKPYLPYVDSHPEAEDGFTRDIKDYRLSVEFPGEWLKKVPKEHQETLREILSQDPRPSYQEDKERVYGMAYAGMEIHFTVAEGLLTVCGVTAKTIGQ